MTTFPCPECGEPLRKKDNQPKYVCDNPDCSVIEVDALFNEYVGLEVRRIKYDARPDGGI